MPAPSDDTHPAARGPVEFRPAARLFTQDGLNRTGIPRPPSGFGLADRILPKMENAGRQGGVRIAPFDRIRQVVRLPAPPLATTGMPTRSLTAAVSSKS